MSPKRWIIALITGLLLSMSGCGSRMAVTRESWQANGRVIPPVGAMWHRHPIADGFEPPVIMIGEGEPVRILRNHLGFTKVQLSDLRTGWVARGTVMR